MPKKFVLTCGIGKLVQVFSLLDDSVVTLQFGRFQDVANDSNPMFLFGCTRNLFLGIRFKRLLRTFFFVWEDNAAVFVRSSYVVFLHLKPHIKDYCSGHTQFLPLCSRDDNWWNCRQRRGHYQFPLRCATSDVISKYPSRMSLAGRDGKSHTKN